MKSLCVLSLLVGFSCTTASPPSPAGTRTVQALPVRIISAKTSPTGTHAEPSQEYDAGLRRAAATYRAVREWLDALGVPHAAPDEPLDICPHDNASDLQSAAESNDVIIGRQDLAFFVRRGRGTTHVLRTTLTRDSLVDRVLLQHEISHHTLTAVGLHREGVTWPTWLAEGIATQFEVQLPDVPRRGDLPVNSFRREDFLTAARAGTRIPLSSLVSQADALDPRGRRANVSYAQAWATVSYLSTRQREHFVRFLRDLSKRPADRRFNAVDELAEFERNFGRADDTLQQTIATFVESLGPAKAGRSPSSRPSPALENRKER